MAGTQTSHTGFPNKRALEGNHGDGEALVAETAEHVVKAIDSLSHSERLALSLLYIEVLTVAETAAVMVCTESEVRQAQRRAEVLLATSLNEA